MGISNKKKKSEKNQEIYEKNYYTSEIDFIVTLLQFTINY